MTATYPGRGIGLRLLLTIFAAAFLGTTIFGPPARAGGTVPEPIQELVDRVKPVYLNLDAADRTAIASARTAAKNLTDPELDAIIRPFLTSEVRSRLRDPASTLKAMARDAADTYYSENDEQFESTIMTFKETWQDEIAALLGSDATVHEVWEFALTTEQHLPDAIKTHIGTILETFIKQKPYDEVAAAFADILKTAMNLALEHHPDFKGKLEALGWRIDMIVSAKNHLRDKVDHQKKAEQAFLKGYIRSVTKPKQSQTIYRGDSREYDLIVLPEAGGGFTVPGSLLTWSSSRPEVAYFAQDNKLVAKAVGTTTVTATHPRAEQDWGWLARFDVTVIERPRERAPEWVPPTLPVQPTPEGVDLSGSARRTTTTKPDGTTKCTVSLDAGAFRSGLEADPSATNFIVDAMEDVDEREILVPGDGLELLAQRGASLTIRTTQGNLIIPAGAIDARALAQQLGADPSKVQIRVSIRRIPQDEANRAKEKAATINGLAPIGEVVEIAIEATADGRSVEIAAAAPPNGAMPQAPWAVASAGAVPVPAAKARAIKCEIPYTAEQVAGVKDVRKLGAYRFEEAAQTWEYVRSTVDAANRKVTFFSPARGKYCVMVYEKTFADIAGHWAQEDIELMASKHVVKGITPDSAGPDLTVTRAQFAALLARALGLREAGSEAARFSDVAPGAWYAGVVGAAAQAGLVKGYDDGTFGPEKPITRAEMAVVLSRAQQAYGEPIAVTPVEAERALGRFSDGAAVPDWARRDMARAIVAELIRGVELNKLEPGGLATRAQAMTVTRRMMEKFGML